MPLNKNPKERTRPGLLLLKQWAKIAAIEEKEGSAIRKLTKHMQAMHDLAKNATTIHKKLKEDLAIAMSELKKLTRAKEESGVEKVAFRETLDSVEIRVIAMLYTAREQECIYIDMDEYYTSGECARSYVNE